MNIYTMTPQERREHIGKQIEDIRDMMAHPGSRPLTSMGMKYREDRRHEIATSIKLNGGEVTPEYRNQ